MMGQQKAAEVNSTSTNNSGTSKMSSLKTLSLEDNDLQLTSFHTCNKIVGSIFACSSKRCGLIGTQTSSVVHSFSDCGI